MTEGLHVSLGLVLVPVVLAKLWSVMPKLFTWPPLRSVAELLERLSLVMIVGGIVFEMATGILNIQYDYLFGFNFYTAHYFGAWVFITGFVVHVALKFPTMVRSLRSRSLAAELRTPLAETEPEPPDADGLVPTDPGAPHLEPAGGARPGGRWVTARRRAHRRTEHRRGRPGGRPAHPPGPLVRRRPERLPGQQDGGGRVDRAVGHRGRRGACRSRAARARSPWTGRRSWPCASTRRTCPSPASKGWSTTQRWTGVRLADLAELAGVPHPAKAHVQSLEGGGGFSEAWLQQNQVLDPDALLALCVNGVDLSPDHGFPARVIVPALPGVHCTKWVRSIEFVR